MRRLCLATASLVLAAGATAPAPARADRAPADDGEPEHERNDERRRFGLSASAGVPDGVMGALTLTLLPRVQIHAGAGHNTVSPGVRGGLRLFFLTSSITPYLAVEGGHYFAGPGPDWADSIAQGAGLGEDADVEKMSYDFGNAHLGLVLGSHRAAFFVQAGVSILAADVDTRIIESAAMPGVPPGMRPTIEVESHSTLRIVIPAGRIGLIVGF